MSKTRSVFAGMLILTCLISPFAFSAFGTFDKKPNSNEANPQLPVLSSDEFKQKVTMMDAQNQAKLDAQLAKLLGSTQQPPANNFTATPAPASSSTTTTPTDNTPTTTTTPAPASTSSGGLNLYQN